MLALVLPVEAHATVLAWNSFAALDTLYTGCKAEARAAGHAAVLETAGGVFALMLEIKIAETRPCAGGARRVKTRVAFLARYDLVIRCIQNEFAVSPYSGRFDSALHAPSFFPERLELSAVDFGKVALHIQHAAAVAGISELSDIIGSGTSYTLKK